MNAILKNCETFYCYKKKKQDKTENQKSIWLVLEDIRKRLTFFHNDIHMSFHLVTVIPVTQRVCITHTQVIQPFHIYKHHQFQTKNSLSYRHKKCSILSQIGSELSYKNSLIQQNSFAFKVKSLNVQNKRWKKGENPKEDWFLADQGILHSSTLRQSINKAYCDIYTVSCTNAMKRFSKTTAHTMPAWVPLDQICSTFQWLD